jgi:hypothetical protein
MEFKKWLQKLEKKKIISQKPHPLLPFILAIISYIIKKLIIEQTFQQIFLYLTLFTLIFAIIHLIVVITLKSKKNKPPPKNKK